MRLAGKLNRKFGGLSAQEKVSPATELNLLRGN